MQVITKLISLTWLLLLVGVACSPVSQESASESSANPTETRNAQTELEIDTLKFTVVPAHSSEEREKRFEQLAAYLEEKIGIPVTIELSETYNDSVELMVNEETLLAYLGPFSYVKAKEGNSSLEPLVAHIDEESGRPWYSSVIVVRKDSGIESLQDIQGKRFGFVSESSTSGFLVPSAAFKEVQITPEKDFAEVKYAGGHDKNATALSKGEVDAAAMTNRTFMNSQKSGELPEAEYKILWESEPIPNSPFVINSKLPTDLKNKIQEAFVNAPEEIVGITNTESSGFTMVQDADYEPIRRLQELVGVQED